MIDILKIIIVLLFMFILLRKKWNIGYVLMFATVLVCIFYLISIDKILLIFRKGIISNITFKLLVVLTSIRAFEIILRKEKVLKKMMIATKNMLRNKKAVIISMPLLIGMLPSVGGAYFTAPMVDELTKDIKITPEEKAFANYWYRHPWEFILPLYPGIVLASAITSIELRKFMLFNLPYALTMFLFGFFHLQKIKGRFKTKGKFSIKEIINFLPILILVLSVILLHIEIHYSLVAIVISMLIFLDIILKRLSKLLNMHFQKIL